MRNILVIKLGAFGDFIIALGAMEAIKMAHYNDKITLITTPLFKEIAEKSGYFDEVHIIKRYKYNEIKNWLNLKKFLVKGKFDRVYDLQLNDRTKMFYYFLFPFFKKPEWSGVIKSAGKLAYKNPAWREMHAFDRHAEILKLAEIDFVKLPDNRWMNADLSEHNIKKPYILMIPGCAPTRLEKRWNADKYGEVSKIMQSKGVSTVLIGTASEADVLDKIQEMNPDAIYLGPQVTLFEMASLAREAEFSIGNDTGPLHLAAISGSTCIALFSHASDPKYSAPRGKDVRVLRKENLNDLSVKEVLEQCPL